MTTYDALNRPDLARLERNARFYEYDPTLEAAADLYESDPAAWQQLHPLIQDKSGFYIAARDDYRAAVAAGAIPPKENTR